MAVHHMKVTFDIRVSEWRMDDPTKPKNHLWALEVFDKNNGEWIRLKDCTRPGESCTITNIEYLGLIQPEDEASGSTPEDSTDVVNS
jgi:hypothetical protein